MRVMCLRMARTVIGLSAYIRVDAFRRRGRSEVRTLGLKRATTLTLTVAAALVALEAGPSDSSRDLLENGIGLSTVEIGRLDRNDVVARSLDVKNKREVATLGVVRIRTSPAKYVEKLADIASFKKTTDVLQIGVFSDVPTLADVAAMTIEDSDLQHLRSCRVDHCDLRLPAEAIKRIHMNVDWRASDSSAQASRLLKQLFVDYVGRYRQNGTTAGMEYADRAPRVDVEREFASLLAADTLTSSHAPRLRRHLLDPNSPAEKITDFVYWSKELVRGRPVISMTHVAIAAALDDSPVAYAIGSKQIYAMHYFDASLGLTLLVPDRVAASPAMYVVYLNRSRIDLFEGLFGGVARRIVAGKARGLVAEQLQRLQRVLGSNAAVPERSR